MKKIILIGLMMLITTSVFAEKVLKYPTNAETTENKMTFCYIAQEKLRLEHNANYQDYLDGKITAKQRKNYLEKEFDPKSDLISKDIIINKKAMKISTKYEADLNDLEKTILTP